MNQSSITTGTSWTPTSVFVGPLLLDVKPAAGVTSGTLTFKTLDDYCAPIPREDVVRICKRALQSEALRTGSRGYWHGGNMKDQK